MSLYWASDCGRASLYLGDSTEELADVIADVVITDPPFSERTHDRYAAVVERCAEANIHGYRHDLRAYAGFTPRDVRAFCATWGPRTRGWVVAFTDHVLFPAYSVGMDRQGRTPFSPVPVFKSNGVRLDGDGPASRTCYLAISKSPKRLRKVGSLPGFYRYHPDVDGRPGGKSVQLMLQIVRDYSHAGELVADPYCGFGTTGVAALRLGRRFVGGDVDPLAVAEAARRLQAELAQTSWGCLFDAERVVQTELPGVRTKPKKPTKQPRARAAKTDA